jgi:N-acetyl-anhydromuramyl-L-alanine amidase AmpD
LAQTGVLDNPTRAAITAFQRRFRPERIDGLIDEQTQMLLAALAHAR